MFRIWALALLFLITPHAGFAQSVMDARTAEFVPSSDHSRQSGGVDMVSSYQMRIYAVGGTQPIRTVDLGKPAPQSDGRIRIDFVSRLSSPLPAGVQYEARVAAVGPGGSGLSASSNPFSYTVSQTGQTCTYTVTPASVASSSAGASGTIAITTAAGCSWTVTGTPGWMTVQTTGGMGSGAISFSVSRNTQGARNASLTIAGRTVGVSQAAPQAGPLVAPSNVRIVSAGGRKP
ncbi:hypothetical protein BH24ACI4_BH24ACI4_21910 [soil metagenome]